MSNVSIKPTHPAVDLETTSPPTTRNVPWNPWLGVIFVVIVYFVSQLLVSYIVSIYPLLKHWSQAQAADWLNNSISVKFVYILLVEAVTLGAIYLFLRRYKLNFSSIGLRRPRFSDPFYGLAAIPIYYILFIICVAILKHFVPSLNLDQQQQLGFNSDNIHGTIALTLTFMSLVILPPIAEEIMVRGFLYSSLKKGFPIVWAVIVTSGIFAAAHLPEGGAAGPLYIAAIDTFVLSLVLIYLREKTGGLWAPITLHASKNAIAYFALFIAPHLHFY